MPDSRDVQERLSGVRHLAGAARDEAQDPAFIAA
jgi:hypothetical protein